MDAEIGCILARCPGYTADYVEDQPVLFRTRLMKKFIKEAKEKNDGAGVVNKK